MKTFEFAITYQTRCVVIDGTATVVGDYDSPAEPEAIVRAVLGALQDGKDSPVRMTWMNEPVNPDEKTCKHGTLENYQCVLCESDAANTKEKVPGPPNPPKVNIHENSDRW